MIPRILLLPFFQVITSEKSENSRFALKIARRYFLLSLLHVVKSIDLRQTEGNPMMWGGLWINCVTIEDETRNLWHNRKMSVFARQEAILETHSHTDTDTFISKSHLLNDWYSISRYYVLLNIFLLCNLNCKEAMKYRQYIIFSFIWYADCQDKSSVVDLLIRRIDWVYLSQVGLFSCWSQIPKKCKNSDKNEEIKSDWTN